MNQGKPQASSLRELIEAAFEQCAEQGGSQVAVGGGVEQGVVPAGGAPLEAANDGASALQSVVVVGEVLDTHHPHLPGRVLVRWLEPRGQVVERWVQRERHLSLRQGDGVLLTLPAGWNQWIVTGALGREPTPVPPDADNERLLRLEPGESVRILSHEGQPLVTLRQGPDGPVIELGQGNLDLAAARTLRLSADTVEIRSAGGGTALLSEGDLVVRGRTIRLN